jgi:hypothetical protein
MSQRLVSVLTAAGTAHAASTAEAVLASVSLPANFFQAGQVCRLRAAVLATATVSTDTLTVVVRVGGTTLTGTVCASSGAVDVADNDVVIVDLQFTVRSVGTAGVVIVDGFCTAAGAEGTVTARAAYQSLAPDTTAALLVELTADWSTTSANSCRAESFVFECLS